MIIDGHSHVTLPIDEHIQAMDSAGIDKTVLFSTTFHPELAGSAQEVKTSMQYLNDLLSGRKGSLLEARKKSVVELTNAVTKFPNRYIGFGAVPTGLDLNATEQYIDENICKNNLAGMGEFALGSNQAHLMKNIFASSAEFNDLPIWIHAFFPLTLQDIRDISVMAKKHPQTPVILGHLGGSNWMETMDLVSEISNLYLDTSAYYSTLILGMVINELPKKCIFGVDRPFGNLELSKQAILKLAKSSAVANAVLGENIQRILSI
jgi:uncharacterized protein